MVHPIRRSGSEHCYVLSSLAFWEESRMIKHTNTLVAGVLIRDRLDSCALKRGQIGLRLALATHVVAFGL